MTKSIEPATAYHVISEPGDATRYDYYIIAPRTSPGTYFFFSDYNNFPYPDRLEYWEILHEAPWPKNHAFSPGIHDLAAYYSCNPHTVAECIRTIFSLEGRPRGEITCR